jgi:hypothetical protein
VDPQRPTGTWTGYCGLSADRRSTTSRLTAYAQIAVEALQHLDRSIQSESSKQKTVELEERYQQQHTQSKQTIDALSKDIAVKDQIIASLVAEKSVLETALFKAVHRSDSLQEQMEAAVLEQARANQR